MFLKAKIQDLIEKEIDAIKNIPIDGMIEKAIEILFDRIHQKKDYKENNNYQLKMKENSSKIDENMIKKDVNGLEDKDLEKSLIKLGVSILKLEK